MTIKKKKITVDGYEYGGESYDRNSFFEKANDDLLSCFKAYIERVYDAMSLDIECDTPHFLLDDEGDEELKHMIVSAIVGAMCNDGNDGKYAYDLQDIKELSEELCEFYY